MLRSSHILSFIYILGLVSLCLTNGFAHGDGAILEGGFDFATADGAAYIQAPPELRRAPQQIIGSADFEKMRDLSTSSQDYQLGRKVGLIVIPSRDNPEKGYVCTGFLVGPDLFMTNHHCIHDKDGQLPLGDARIFMDYYQDLTVDSTGGGLTARVSGVVKVDSTKDYALLRLDSAIGDTYGWLELDTSGRPNSSQSVKLISHPKGRSKEIVRSNSQIVVLSTATTNKYPFLLAYLADTEGGSSGSPVFLRNGTAVIGIHHSAYSDENTDEPLFNAGSLMSHIVPEIQQYLPVNFNPPTVANQTFPANTPITPLTLPAAVGGTAPYTYTLLPTPAGLQFNSTTRRLGGTPTTPGTTNLTYTATDTNRKTKSLTFTIRVTNPPPRVTDPPPPAPITFTPATIANQTFPADTPITPLTLPLASGGTPPYTYTLSPIPDGLQFNSTTRRLGGTPTTPGTTNLTYTATDTNRKTKSLTFTIRVTDPPPRVTDLPPRAPITFTPATIANQTFPVDTPITPLILPLASGGTPPYTYTLSPIPDGLQFNSTTRRLSGTPTAVGIRTVTYTATDASQQTAALTFSVQVTDPPPPAITFTPAKIANQTFPADTPITPLILPLASGGTPPYTYTLSPIPDGLQFNSTTRRLSGTPTAVGIRTVTYTATDASQQTAALTFSVQVTDPPPPAITFTPATIANQTFPVDTPITPLTLPLASGGTPSYTYTLSPIPDGLQFNSATRELSGTPTTPGTTNTKYTATDASQQTAVLTFMIKVLITFNPATIDDQTFTVDVPIQPVTLPIATGGAPPYLYIYTLSPIPDGLQFNGITRILSGTPSILAEGITNVTYTARNLRGTSASLNFTIEVLEEGIPADSPVDVNGDGVVDVADLVIVATAYGTQVPPGTDLPADVNSDGVVNLIDLTLVANAIDAAGGGANAPSLINIETVAEGSNTVSAGNLAYRNVAAALADAKLENGIPETVLKVLQHLLIEIEMAEIPESTALLPNYPNPFNPETWIPYHLATDATVVLTVYDTRGSVVRELKLGHQAAGVYESRGRAAYWDGKNQIGEHIASGLYFYTLTAGDFTATRKLLIAK